MKLPTGFVTGLLALLLFTAGSCKKDNPVQPVSYDRYNLISVDGGSLPAEVDSGSDWIEEVTTGRVDLFADGRFTTSFTWRRTSQSTGVTTESETESGTYQISGTTLSATYDTGSSISGTISGNDITVTEDGHTLVFRK